MTTPKDPVPFDELSGITVPRAFGTYRVLHQAGGGAHGPVFRAHDAEQDCLAAVKVFGRGWAREDVIALAAALEDLTRRPRLDPLFVPLLAAGVEGPFAFLAMEFEPGQTLDQAIRHLAPAPVEQIVTLLEPLARAIDAAWMTGLGHGALHPRDLFLSPHGALERVTGFGVVQAIERTGRPFPSRRAYGAPERSRAGWDVRADVFSLGAIAHELLTRRRPIAPGEQDGELGADIPARQRVQIRTVLDTALAERPDARFGSAATLLAALAETIGLRIELPSPDAPRFSMPFTDDDVRHSSPALRDKATAEADPLSRGDIVLPAFVRPANTSGADIPAEIPPTMLGAEPARAPIPVDEVVLVQTTAPGIDATELAVEPETPGAAIDRWDLDRPAILTGPPVGPPGVTRRLALPLLVALTLAGLLIGSGAAFLFMHRPSAPATTAPPAVTRSAAPRSSVAEPPRQEPRIAAPSQASAPRATTAARGVIAVQSEPAGALVTIDGRRVGATPVSAEDLSLGSHTMRVARPGYVPRTEEVILTSAAPARTLVVRLTAGVDLASQGPVTRVMTGRQDGESASVGAIDVDSRPRGARVSIDGRFLGLAPLRLSELAPGAHVLLLEAEGKSSVSRRVQVEAGQVTRVRVDLE